MPRWRPITPPFPISARSVYECYLIAVDEAERAQTLANKKKGSVRQICLARRNAASRIARLIRFGRLNRIKIIDTTGRGRLR